MAFTEDFNSGSGELNTSGNWTKGGSDPANRLLDFYTGNGIAGLGVTNDSGSGDCFYTHTGQGSSAYAQARLRNLKVSPRLCVKLTDNNNHGGFYIGGTGSAGARLIITDGGVEDDNDIQFQGVEDEWYKVTQDGSGGWEVFTGGTGASPSFSSAGTHTDAAHDAETVQGFTCEAALATVFGGSQDPYWDDYETGTLGGGGNTGTAAQTLPAVTQSATGIMTFTATADQTLASLTQSASGSTISGNTGTIAQTLPSITQSADGSLQFSGTTSQMLAAITQSASGGLTFTGTAAQTLASIVQSASGGVGRVATISQTLPVITQDGTGELSFTSTSSQILPAITQSAQESEDGEIIGPPGSMFTSKGSSIKVSFKKSRFRK